jgi:DNA-binding NarL/FixJ family response regulator
MTFGITFMVRTERKAAAKKAVRILIVDDHPLVRRGIRDLIRSDPDLEVCGEAEGAPEAMALLGQSHPDLVLVDISLKRGHGLELVRQIKAHDPSTKMLVVSMHDEPFFAERALGAGAQGYICKQEATERMMEAVHSVLAGKVFLSPTMADRVLQRVYSRGSFPDDKPMAKLSVRELAVFELIGRGLSTRQISLNLQLSVKTIETYREHIKKKLRLKTASELTHYATYWVLEKGARRNAAF